MSSYQLPDLATLCINAGLTLRTNPLTRAVEDWLLNSHQDERAVLKSAKIGLLAGVCFPTFDLMQFREATEMCKAVVCSNGIVGRNLDQLAGKRFPDTDRRDDFISSASESESPSDDIEDAIARRKVASGIPLLLSLLEYDASSDQRVFELESCAVEIITWSWDIFKYISTPTSAPPTNNLLTSIKQLHTNPDLPVQSAINIAAGYIQRTFDRFVQIEKELAQPESSSWYWQRKVSEPTFEELRDRETYVRGLKDFIIGCINWSYETEVFFGDKGEDVKSFGWVFMAE